MVCDATATCRYKQLPMVSKGALCTPGQQLCEPGAMCLAAVVGNAGTCMAMCSKDSDCNGGAVCAGDYATGPMFCQQPVTLPSAAKFEGRAAPKGCSAAPGGLWVLAGLAGLLRRRARS